MKYPKITCREELNNREINEIATVLEGARRSNHIDVDRKKFREHLDHVLVNAGLIDSPEYDDKDPAFEETFAQFTTEPANPRDQRDKFQELADLIDPLERKLRHKSITRLWQPDYDL